MLGGDLVDMKTAQEADAVWEAINKTRASRREARANKYEIENFRASNPKIEELFADLKRKLNSMTQEEWDSMPITADYSSKKGSRAAVTVFTAVGEGRDSSTDNFDSSNRKTWKDLALRLLLLQYIRLATSCCQGVENYVRSSMTSLFLLLDMLP